MLSDKRRPDDAGWDPKRGRPDQAFRRNAGARSRDAARPALRNPC